MSIQDYVKDCMHILLHTHIHTTSAQIVRYCLQWLEMEKKQHQQQLKWKVKNKSWNTGVENTCCSLWHAIFCVCCFCQRCYQTCQGLRNVYVLHATQAHANNIYISTTLKELPARNRNYFYTWVDMAVLFFVDIHTNSFQEVEIDCNNKNTNNFICIATAAGTLGCIRVRHGVFAFATNTSSF